MPQLKKTWEVHFFGLRILDTRHDHNLINTSSFPARWKRPVSMLYRDRPHGTDSRPSDMNSQPRILAVTFAIAPSPSVRVHRATWKIEGMRGAVREGRGCFISRSAHTSFHLAMNGSPFYGASFGFFGWLRPLQGTVTAEATGKTESAKKKRIATAEGKEWGERGKRSKHRLWFFCHNLI